MLSHRRFGGLRWLSVVAAVVALDAVGSAVARLLRPQRSVIRVVARGKAAGDRDIGSTRGAQSHGPLLLRNRFEGFIRAGTNGRFSGSTGATPPSAASTAPRPRARSPSDMTNDRISMGNNR
jgi:hypothetical protein